MTRFRISLISILVMLPLWAHSQFEYLSPLPGSRFVSLQTGLILRAGESLRSESLTSLPVTLSGSKSGGHTVSLRLSDDGRTIVGKITPVLAPDEDVTVTVGRGFFTAAGAPVAGTSWSFTTTVLTARPTTGPLAEDARPIVSSVPPIALSRIAGVDSLPADFPQWTVSTSTNPSPGYFYMTVSQDVPGVGNYLMMIDNAGKVVKYAKAGAHYIYDFKVQPGGQITYGQLHETYWFAGGGYSTHMVVDSTLKVIDSVQCGNGYIADGHDFVMLPNGHALLLAYDVQPVDMSKIVTGGSPAAWVSGSIIQELDLERNVVFQWRSWDYVPITDSYQNLKLTALDYIHINSLDVDADGNIIAGARLVCAVYKIDRKTGSILWTLGGKKNAFAFVNEHAENAPTYFYFPHDAHLLPNGHLIMMDNGNGHTPSYSRGVEYALDQKAMTATMVWEFRHSPDVFGATQGSAMRMPNGNTVLNWGSAALTGSPEVTEVTSDGTIVFELTMLGGVSSYRTYKFGTAPFLAAAQVTQTELAIGNTYAFDRGDTNATGVSMTLDQGTGGYNSATVARYALGAVAARFSDDHAPYVPPQRYVISQTGFGTFRTTIEFDSLQLRRFVSPSQVVIYQRPFEGTGTFFPMTTEYDPITHALRCSVNQLGEFVLGIPSPLAMGGRPTLLTPPDSDLTNQTLPVPFRWASYGLVNRFRLQASSDSLFASTMVDDSTLTSSFRPWTAGIEGPARLYWHVKALTDTGWTGWSSRRMFQLTAPFITYQSPAAGTKLTKGSKPVIRWKDNITEPVRIRLIKGTTRVLVISDSTASSGVFQWTVPSNVAADTGYAIRIESRIDSTLLAVGPAIRIADSLTAVSENSVPTVFALSQNYPNPFNPSTTIDIRIAQMGNVRLAVFDILGREVAVLVNDVRPAGDYHVRFDASHLASGVYVARLQSGSRVAFQKMVLLK